MAAINRRRKRLLLRMHSQVIHHNIARGFIDLFLDKSSQLQPGDILQQDENVMVVVDKIDGDRMDLTATVTQRFDNIYMTLKLDDESEEP